MIKNKKIKSIFLTLWIMLYSVSFAWIDAKLDIWKEKYNIDDTIKLQLEIDTTENWDFSLKDIKWLENFWVIAKSQSSSFINMNWNSKNQISFTYSLKANKAWDYEIGPAIIINWTDEIKTNTVKVSITWEKVFINNSKPTNNNIWNKIDKEISFNWDNNSIWKSLIQIILIPVLIFISIFISIFILIWYLIYYFTKKSLEKTQKNKENNLEIDISSIKNIIYPELWDINFEEKIENIFKNYLEKKYNISTTKKSYKEIIDELKYSQDLEIIKQIATKIQELKYSNLIINKQNLLEMVKWLRD